MNEEITPEFPEGKDNYCPRCYFEDDKTILRSECPHSSPAKNCPIEDCTRENGHVGFHIWGRDTVSPAKNQAACEHDYENAIRKGRAKLHCPKCDQDITLELVFMHEAIDQTASLSSSHEGDRQNVSGEEFKEVHCDGSCANPTHKDQPQPEWEEELRLKVKFDRNQDREVCILFIQRMIKKEYERGREEAEGIMVFKTQDHLRDFISDIRAESRSDAFDEVEKIVEEAATKYRTSSSCRNMTEEIVERLKANRDI